MLLAVKGIRFVGEGVGGEGCKVEEKKKKKNTQNTQNTQILTQILKILRSASHKNLAFFLLFFLLASRTSRSAWALSCTWSAGHRGCPEGVPRSASA